MKKLQKVLCKILPLILLSSSLNIILNPHNKEEASANIQIITISSVEEWTALAKKCVEDDFSIGKTIQLEKNIVFSGDFTPIPYMNGTFEGQGNTLSGITFSGTQSDTAVFRYVSENGSVKDLTCEVTIEDGSHMSNMGGVVAHNQGIVEKVTLRGDLNVDHGLGGIVAVNEEGAIIKNCHNEAMLCSKEDVGGITAVNHGFIMDSENKGAVNSTLEKQNFTNCGGIVGNNHGLIKNCENAGQIGIRHMGYNVGGIAGLNDGVITESSNIGKVYGRKDVGGVVGQFSPYVHVQYEELLVETVSNSAQNINSLSEQLSEELIGLQMQTASAAYGAAQGTVTMFQETDFSSVNREINPEEDVSEQLKETKKQLKEVDYQTDSLKENRENYSIEVQRSMDRISTLSRQIHNEMEVVDNSVEAVKSESIEDWVVDISASGNADQGHGYVLSCSNTGEVYGDSNTGGIVGTMDFDNTTHPQEDFDFSGEQSIKSQTTIQAVVDSCENLGYVNSMNQYAGGIAGLCNRGYVVSNTNMGEVKSDSGSYVGGIAAYSKIAVEKSKAHCVLSGKSYVGGIVGYGEKVTDCTAIVSINDGLEKTGAISGNIVEEAANNYYSGELMGGMDGISFTGKAEEISHDYMKQLLLLPDDFFELQIIFLANGVEVFKQVIAFGGNITDDMIPVVPENEEYSFGEWEDFERENIQHSMVIHAIYENYTTTVATDEDKPSLLLEGQFKKDTRVEVEDLKVHPHNVNGTIYVHQRFTLVNEIPGKEKEMVAHVLLKDVKQDDIEACLVGEEAVIIPVSFIGDYAVFDLQGCKEYYLIERTEGIDKQVVIIVVLVTLILVMIPVLVVQRIRKKEEEEIRKITEK